MTVKLLGFFCSCLFVFCCIFFDFEIGRKRDFLTMINSFSFFYNLNPIDTKQHEAWQECNVKDLYHLMWQTVLLQIKRCLDYIPASLQSYSHTYVALLSRRCPSNIKFTHHIQRTLDTSVHSQWLEISQPQIS